MPGCVGIKAEVAALLGTDARTLRARSATASSTVYISPRFAAPLGAFHVSPTAFGISCPAVKSTNRPFVLFLLGCRGGERSERRKSAGEIRRTIRRKLDAFISRDFPSCNGVTSLSPSLLLPFYPSRSRSIRNSALFPSAR